MDLSSVTIIIQLIFLEGILSIDNAAVLGAMVAHLPNDKPIPWPRWIRIPASWHGRMGNQREAALKVGLLGAYLGRGLMLLLASVIISCTWASNIWGNCIASSRQKKAMLRRWSKVAFGQRCFRLSWQIWHLV
jgi:predicted tellurium resistance membrane protein TerC